GLSGAEACTRIWQSQFQSVARLPRLVESKHDYAKRDKTKHRSRPPAEGRPPMIMAIILQSLFAPIDEVLHGDLAFLSFDQSFENPVEKNLFLRLAPGAGQVASAKQQQGRALRGEPLEKNPAQVFMAQTHLGHELKDLRIAPHDLRELVVGVLELKELEDPEGE